MHPEIEQNKRGHEDIITAQETEIQQMREWQKSGAINLLPLVSN